MCKKSGIFFALVFAARVVLGADAPADFKAVEEKLCGKAIAYVPASSETYIGSPSLCFAEGKIYAMHDLFGPKGRLVGEGRAGLYVSEDRGETWRKIAQFDQFFSKLFYHRGALYIMGILTANGKMAIRRSEDGGKTWSEPKDENSGLFDRPIKGYYFHTAPTSMIVAKGRIWRALELKKVGAKWEDPLAAVTFSAPEDADLLKSSSWQYSNPLTLEKDFITAALANWLEGNMVEDVKTGAIYIMPRLTSASDDLSVLIDASADGKSVSFDKSKVFRFPGGGKKFSVRYDAKSGKYYALSNHIEEEFRGADRNGKVRNTVMLVSCKTLGAPWIVESVIFKTSDVDYRGFQYLDWDFDGDDIIALSRTSAFDGAANAHNQHDANFLTFHRIKNFRDRTLDTPPINND